MELVYLGLSPFSVLWETDPEDAKAMDAHRSLWGHVFTKGVSTTVENTALQNKCLGMGCFGEPGDLADCFEPEPAAPAIGAMTVGALRAMAKERGIDLPSGYVPKGDLIGLLAAYVESD